MIIYGFHPLALQGSVLFDVDNTRFTPAILLLAIALISTQSVAPTNRIIDVALCYPLMF